MIENGTVTKEISMKKKILNKLTYIFGKPLTYVYIFVISFIAGIVCYYFGYRNISWGLLLVTISSNAVLLFTGINEMIDDYFE